MNVPGRHVALTAYVCPFLVTQSAQSRPELSEDGLKEVDYQAGDIQP